MTRKVYRLVRQMRRLDIFLVSIFLLSVAFLFLTNEDPFERKMVYAYTGWHPVVEHAKAYYKVLYDLSVGTLITLFFYALVVRLPDYEKRRRLKGSLERRYRDFKEDCIRIMIEVAGDAGSEDHPDGLMEPDKFRDYFHERVTPDRERWHELWNNINRYYLHELLIRMETLRDEIAFVLNNTDIPKDEPFEFLKRLSVAIYLVKDITLNDDELKPFARFLWWMFTGWDAITGDAKGDPIAKMIDLI